MIDYYNLIMGKEDSCFLSLFNKTWEKEILSHNLPYTNALQICNGNRLRPLLVAWGYYSNCDKEANSCIIDYAVSIELLHKASILLDDLIDDDTARHGQETFHVQYSKSEALLYALYMLNRSIELIHEKDIIKHSYTSMLLRIVDNMARGGIKEISSTNTIFSINEVKEIIELETISLIKNSFILGYRLSTPAAVNIPDAIINIGYSCGYCFQVLNDIEPFSAPYRNQKYKGNINYDFEKERKNIVVSFLYGCCTQHERKKLIAKTDFDLICKLVNKYNILPILLTELETEILKILQEMQYFKDDNSHFYTDFKKFLVTMFNICYKKCELSIKENLFNN